MARESKYNLDVPQIPDGEPIMLFRAQDVTFPALLEAYAMLCNAMGSPSEHIDHIRAVRTNVLVWQGQNKDKVKALD